MEFFNYSLYLMVRQKRTEKNLKLIKNDMCISDHADLGQTVVDQITNKKGIIESIHISWQHLEGYYYSAVIKLPGDERIRVLWEPRGVFLSREFRNEIFRSRERYKIVEEKNLSHAN